MNENPSLHLWLIPLLPFIGFLLNGLLGRFLSKTLVSTIALLFTAAPLALVLSVAFRFSSLALPHVERLPFPWIETSTFRADFAFLLDPLTLVMLLVVTGVGFLIHIYSVGYMAEEEGYWRFFAYLNLFMFFMLTLVLAENFLLMFVGWEGVGLASYLLVGFYYLRKSAADAGKKAFILNRIGDFGFLLAMFLMPTSAPSASARSSPPSPRTPRCKTASSPPSRCCWCSAPPASPRRFRFTSGCRTPWKAPRQSPP
jgi:NADH-quinone oxidoreductase subunit L